jgi:HAD superfamily hydrolase (TIGR01509 family)
MSIKVGVLWDMDGVLVDTGEAHFQSWMQTFSARDIPFTREQFKATFGMNNAGILKLLLGDDISSELISEIADHKERLFRQIVKGNVKPLPGVMQWLEQLKAWGVKQASASSAPPANIDTLVSELKIRPYFDAVVSGADLPGKPDPAVFLKSARLIDVPAQNCVVIEDGIAGVQGARRGGMKCIAVTTTNPPDALHEADVIVEGLHALSPDMIRQLVDGDKLAQAE